MEIYLVRHGQTLWNTEKRLQGSADIELNETGRKLAQITGEALMDTPIDIIYSSPLKRAYETATLIRNGRAIPIITDKRIMEISFGSMEGRCQSELIMDPGLSFRYFFDKPELYCPPEDGETFSHLIERGSEFMREVIEPLADTHSRVMVVAHAAINKAIMSYIKKHPINDFWSGGFQHNCNVIILNYTNQKYTIIDESKIFYGDRLS